MAIQRWDPVKDLFQLRHSVNRMFEDVLSRSPSPVAAGGATWKPAIDVLDEGERYVVRADLPGMRPQDVDVQVEDRGLVVRGERRTDAESSREMHLRVERPSGRFATRVSLPRSVDLDRIAASHHNGVLEISLPKRRLDTTSRIAVSDGQ